ncbi:hypothetical protein ACPUEN_02705 [Algoriphagus yeomjeoni]|uniref:hypothetical protein n=1 Tax=Algoriphagus yeomjeoni TaxID=291403 RepID=UPI003CE4550A
MPLVSPKLDLDANPENRIGVVLESESPSLHVLLSADHPKTPSFVVDWSVWAKFNSTWNSLSNEGDSTSLFHALFKKSFPLFDVKVTFIHFFYTW